MASTKVVRAIEAFEKAIEDRYRIFLNPQSREARTIAEHNYVKARAKLERLMENV